MSGFHVVIRELDRYGCRLHHGQQMRCFKLIPDMCNRLAFPSFILVLSVSTLRLVHLNKF